MISNADENHSPSTIGVLLVEEGIISQKDLERALEIQRGDAEGANTPFGLILVKNGFISEEELDTLMHHPDFQREIESNLIENGWVDEPELAGCQRKIQPHEQLRDVLLREGYITDKDFKIILNQSLDGIGLGKSALKLNMISETEIEAALKCKNYKRTISEILCELSLITISELNLVFQKNNKQPKLGEMLYQLDIIDKMMLEKALQKQGRNRESLGNILVRQNFITVDQLYFALSIQYNIPFHELDDFIFDEKQRVALRDIIGQKFAEEKMLLPLFLNGNNLTVAVFNPSRIALVDELRSFLKQYKITCVLTRDEKFEQLFTLLYGEMLDFYRTMDNAPGSDDKFIISNPETDSTRIDDLYRTYETLRGKTGSTFCNSRTSLFREFIKENYTHICDKFHCSRINFYIESRNEQVEILAAPLLKNVTVRGL